MVSILSDEVEEVWIDEHTRALIIPLETGKTIISMDVYIKGWSYPVDEEVCIGDSKLVYYRPKDVESLGFNVEKIEIIGFKHGDIEETISVRLWVSKVNVKDHEIIKRLYSRVLEFISSRKRC